MYFFSPLQLQHIVSFDEASSQKAEFSDIESTVKDKAITLNKNLDLTYSILNPHE